MASALRQSGCPKTGRPPASQPGRSVPSQLSPDVHIAATRRVLFSSHLVLSNFRRPFPLSCGAHTRKQDLGLVGVDPHCRVCPVGRTSIEEQARLQRFATIWSIDPSPLGIRLGFIKITCSVQFPGVASQVVARVTEVGTVINCKSAQLRQSDKPPNNAPNQHGKPQLMKRGPIFAIRPADD
jgi:hypothetical protein